MSSKDIRSFFKPLPRTNITAKQINNYESCKSDTTKIIEQSTSESNKSKKELENNLTALEKNDNDSRIDINNHTKDHSLERKKNHKVTIRDREKSHSRKNCKKLSVNISKNSEQQSVSVDSDSDDANIINATPVKSKPKKRKVQVISSDSEEEEVLLKHGKVSNSSQEKKELQQMLKPVSIIDIFSKAVKQSKVENSCQSGETLMKKEVKSKKKNTEIGIHEDKDFEKTLRDLDDELFLQYEDVLDKTIENAIQKSTDEDNAKYVSTKKDTIFKSNEYFELESNTPGRKRLLDTEKNSRDIISSKKGKFDHTDSGIDDQDRYEKKKYCAMQYQQYLNRSGPKNYGSKELPKGKPDCLNNLCFMRTGVLDSLESEEFENLIKRHGGRVVHAVSKKVNFVVVGDDPGPAKLEKAANYGIPNISEDELLDMILQKSGRPKKYTVSNVSSFEDAGINDSFKSSDSEEIIQISSQEPKSEINRNKTSVTQEMDKKKGLVKRSEEKNSISINETEIKAEIQKQKNENEVSYTKLKIEKHEFNIKRIGESEIDSICLSEKYKPKELKQIVGQQMNTSNMNKLKKWLECWDQNEKLRKQKKIPQPRPWDKINDGAYYKCAMLSGPPGVGKTTTATLVAECLGYDIVEFNASDTRSKKLLQQEVASTLTSKNISSFNIHSTGLNNKRVILMDEVDGMAGNEDRGGMQELINLIKCSKIPIICMCNDRNHQKIRSLANYCFDLRFEKPKPQQILGFVMSICCKEGININPQVATEIINGTTCDIRQTLNQISMLTNVGTGLTLAQAQKDAAAFKKDTILGPWQVCKMVFNEADQKDASLIDKSRLFFYDYSMGPLFVQENYLKVQPHIERKNVMKHVAAAAEAISVGARIDKKIRESNNWSLLDMQAIYSSVLPGHYMSGHFVGPIDFPSWLGKNSKRNKLNRFNNELAMHTKIHTSGGSLAMNLDYSKSLLRSIATPLKRRGLDGVSDAVEVMKSYQLLREDLDSLVELSTWPKQKNMMDGIESKVKAAFTRLYKKEVPVFSYSVNAGVLKRKAIYDDDLNENEELSEPDETIENDNLITAKSKSKSQNKKESVKPSTSKSKKKGKK